MTKEAARTAMKDIDTRMKAAMDASPERAAALKALKDCNDAFNTGVRALLTPEQQAIWDAWLANGPAKGDDKGRDGGRKDGGRGRRGHR